MRYKLLNYCEIDQWASKAYCAIHNVSQDANLGDIREVNLDLIPSCDLLTHGSPCQDFSFAGKNRGGDENSNTRSSLMWNSVKIIEQAKPKFVLWENVKNVLSAKHRHNFAKYIKEMEDLGYNNYWQVLNAKDYGKPQNRERIFCLSIRADIDRPEGYVFPAKRQLQDKLEDYLDFRPKDDLTANFLKRYRTVKDENATEEDFINYLKSIPSKKEGVVGRLMGLYNFREMDILNDAGGGS